MHHGIYEIPPVDEVFDMLCIQETKIDNTFPNSQFHVNGYNIFRRDRKKGGGGVMIFVRDSIIAIPIKIVCKFVEAILLNYLLNSIRTDSLRASSPIWASEKSLAWAFSRCALRLPK